MKNAALIGNPNTGKTSLFNALTSSYEYVGNWSGVTVEKKIGQLNNKRGYLVDLPGIYNLHPLSRDEGVAADYLATECPDLLINIVDASQLERNLYLTIQLLEYGKPVIMGLNMMDVAKSQGLTINSELLGSCLGSTVIPLVARNKEGITTLLDTIANVDHSSSNPDFAIDYGEIVENAILNISRELKQALPNSPSSIRWTSIQILEQNQAVLHAVSAASNDISLMEQLQSICETAHQQLKKTGKDISLLEHIRSIRTSITHEICSKVIDSSHRKPHLLTERIDKIAAHPFWGIPFFLIFMFITFKLTFDWLGNPLSDLLDAFISGPLTNVTERALEFVHASNFTKDLIINGIIVGVGGVIVFIPQIFIMFFIISFIEDSGYMARITVMMDKLMELVGLNGKALIPFIIGFGCNVPAVMASRSIEQPKERTLTMLLIPLMSCSARLPVYALFAGVFFAKSQALIVFSLYVMGIVLALLLAKLFSIFMLKNTKSFFFIELPPYRMPQARTLFRCTWEKGKGFIRKAGTFILGGSVLIWLLTYLGPHGVATSMDDSFLAAIGGLVSTLLAPLGFGAWQSGAALITGFIAKEVVVSTMNIIYHVPDMSGLQNQLALTFTPLQAYSFMAFVLLYTPCLATVGVLRKETASRKYTLFSIIYSLILAYIVSIIIYQGGLWLGLS